MGCGRVFAQFAVGEDRLMKRISNEIANVLSEIVRQFLSVGCEYYMVLRMSTQKPRREDRAGDKALSMARWQENHQSLNFTPFDSLELRNDQFMMRCSYELRPLRNGIAS